MRQYLLAALVWVTACVEAPATHISSQEIITADGLQPSVMLAHREEIRRLGRVALSDHSALMETSDGQLVLSFLVACALPSEATFIAHDGNGLEFDFFGESGLAKHWIERQLRPEEERAVSACIFAHITTEDLVTPLSIRGVNLATSSDERSTWTEQEGAFWGDMFTPRLQWSACRGTAALQDRQCTEQDPTKHKQTLCGMSYAGLCSNVCNGARGVYRSCDHEQQVITTYLLE